MKNILKLGLSVLVVAFLAGCGGGGGGGSGSDGGTGGSGSGGTGGTGGGSGGGSSSICSGTPAPAGTVGANIYNLLSDFPPFDASVVSMSDSSVSAHYKSVPNTDAVDFLNSLAEKGFVQSQNQPELYTKYYTDVGASIVQIFTIEGNWHIVLDLVCSGANYVSFAAFDTEFTTDATNWPLYLINRQWYSYGWDATNKNVQQYYQNITAPGGLFTAAQCTVNGTIYQCTKIVNSVTHMWDANTYADPQDGKFHTMFSISKGFL